jgi:6-phosphogluconate dehydrogenase
MREWDAVSCDLSGGTRETLEESLPLRETATVTPAPALELSGYFPTLIRSGIEHGLARLLSEVFQLLHRTLALSEDELRQVAGAWNLEALHGYDREISATLSRLPGARGGQDALAERLLEAASEFGVEFPTISAALRPREMGARQRREALGRTLSRQPIGRLGLDSESILNELHGAFFAAMIITYAEGLSLLAVVPSPSGVPFDAVQSVRLWKEDSAARAPLLEEIAAVLEATSNLPNLLCDDDISEKLMEHQEFLRRAVWRAHHLDLLTPVMLAALDYMDLRRDAWWPINLVQVPVRPHALRAPA